MSETTACPMSIQWLDDSPATPCEQWGDYLTTAQVRELRRTMEKACVVL